MRAVFLTQTPLLRTQLPSSRPFLPVPLTHPGFSICRCGSLSSTAILILFLWRTASALHSSAPHHLFCETFLDHTISRNPDISPNLALPCASQSSSTKALTRRPPASRSLLPPRGPQSGVLALPLPLVWLVFPQTNSLLQFYSSGKPVLTCAPTCTVGAPMVCSLDSNY